MAHYKVTHNESGFIARVFAATGDDGIQAMLEWASTGKTVRGEVAYPGMEALQKTLTGLDIDGKNPASSFAAQEIPIPRKDVFTGGTCVYCATRPATVEIGDHVFARGFFAEEKRNNAIVYVRLPVCEKCNNAKSHDEEYVIDLVAGSLAATHPDAASLFKPNGVMQRAVERGIGAWKTIIKNSEVIEIPWEGQVVETGAVKPDWGRFQSLFSMVLRGTYYYHTGDILPIDHTINVSQVPDDIWKQVQELLDGYPGVFQETLGDGTVDYSLGIHPKLQAILCLITLYQGFRICVRSQPAG